MKGSRSGGQKQGMGTLCRPWQLPGWVADGMPRWTPKLGMRAREMSWLTRGGGAAAASAMSARRGKESCIMIVGVMNERLGL